MLFSDCVVLHGTRFADTVKTRNKATEKATMILLFHSVDVTSTYINPLKTVRQKWTQKKERRSRKTDKSKAERDAV